MERQEEYWNERYRREGRIWGESPTGEMDDPEEHGEEGSHVHRLRYIFARKPEALDFTANVTLNVTFGAGFRSQSFKTGSRKRTHPPSPSLSLERGVPEGRGVS